MGHWKGIRKDIRDGKLGIALFDLEKDLLEQNDVGHENPEVVDQIRSYEECPGHPSM